MIGVSVTMFFVYLILGYLLAMAAFQAWVRNFLDAVLNLVLFLCLVWLNIFLGNF